ncbi:hypothetical protein PIB30_069702 [Stylosanthes scabra]|uniref:Uncharacterized protein n=1 Tax=Stylosanthes scabra TaxID=79078 RepID=A0ABU6RNR0_9FABA|nr:hypothetical protein [Stylosanthes scabra]
MHQATFNVALAQPVHPFPQHVPPPQPTSTLTLHHNTNAVTPSSQVWRGTNAVHASIPPSQSSFINTHLCIPSLILSRLAWERRGQGHPTSLSSLASFLPQTPVPKAMPQDFQPHAYAMASSSDVSRKRRGKAVVVDEDTFDAHRFKTPFHEHFFNSNVSSKLIIPDTRFNLEEDQYPQIRQQIELRGWKRVNKPKKKISQTIITEFYANARINPNNEVGPRFYTFVRGMLVNFSMDRIKTIMKFEGPLNSETSYRARMVEGNQDLDAPADGYGWGQLQEDMANMSKNQTEFLDSMLAQQTVYGLRLQEMETRQQEMWQFQQEMWQEQHQFQQDVRNYQEQQREQFQSLQKEQEKMHKELTNCKKNFSSHMGKLYAAHEEQKNSAGQTHQVLLSHAMDSQTGNMYTHWALQQANQNLVPMIPTKIPPAIR